MKNNNDLFYTCSLIEYIGRKTHNKRGEVVKALGKETINHIYSYADVFHSDLIDKVADEFIERSELKTGDYDNVGKCKYNVPDYWDIGEVFQRLVEDTSDEEHVVEGIRKVFSSWIAERILNFNSDLFYQPREDYSPTYREMLHQHNSHHVWTAFGIDLLLGIKADAKTSREEQEFLPDNLRYDFDRAYVMHDGKRDPGFNGSHGICFVL